MAMTRASSISGIQFAGMLVQPCLLRSMANRNDREEKNTAQAYCYKT